MTPLLRVDKLLFQRDGFTLRIEHLELQTGRIYLLHGPNGSGKSTLLHLLAMLLIPTAGKLHFHGTPVERDKERLKLRRQITLVEQNPLLFDTSVYQNLAFGLRLRDIHGDLQHRRIDLALRSVGLQGFEQQRAKTLSGGESRRVALARAMVLRPQLLLLDEPTTGLDRDTVPVFEHCLAALPAQGTTVVIASHDTDQQRRLKGENIFLERGHLAMESLEPLAYGKNHS